MNKPCANTTREFHHQQLLQIEHLLNSKFQTPSLRKISNSKLQTSHGDRALAFGVWVIEICLKLGIWDLELRAKRYLIAASFLRSTRLSHSCNSFGSWFCNSICKK